MDFIRKKLIKNKKGQSAIELAIIFPILAMLMIYLFDVAMVINAKMTVNAACRAYLRTVTLHGAAKKNVKNYKPVFDNALNTAESILNQNSLPLLHKKKAKSVSGATSFIEPEYLNPNGTFPLSEQIHMQEDNNPEGEHVITMKICTEVPIRLNKVMKVEIWGENKVKNGMLPICSQYVTAISSTSNEK